MNTALPTMLLNLAMILVIIMVIRSKLKGRERATGELGHLARSLSLTAQPVRAGASISPEDRAQLDASVAGRVGAQLLDALPGARHSRYIGTVDGVRVTMSLGAERRGQSGQERLVEFTAEPALPWRVGLAMAREHAMDHVIEPGRQAHDLATGDDDFSRDVYVRATAPERVVEMLKDPDLRVFIRELLVHQPRSWIDDVGVHVQFAGAVPAPTVARVLVQRMVALVRSLDVMLKTG